MHLLHPAFLIVFAILLLLFAFSERVNEADNKRVLIFVGVVLIILAGGRNWVGADYPIYFSMYYEGFPQYTTYQDVLDKALFRPNSMEIEWCFVLINKIVYDLGMPFFVLTFIIAIISISLQWSTYLKYAAMPVFSVLAYFMANYFFTECGQMRQGLGTAICLFSIRYIINRDLKRFLLCMFFALGMHKSTVVFIPAFWLVKLPFDGRKWVPIILVCVLLAPFKVYNLFGGLITSITPQDVSSAYEGYNQDTYYGNELKTGLSDFINIFFALVVIIFDKPAERKIPYYEYFRNLYLFGICLYYILRGNAIFATRLPGCYLAFGAYLAVPGVLYAVKEEARRVLKIGFVSYFLLFYYAFSKVNADRGRFTIDRYQNVLW